MIKNVVTRLGSSSVLVLVAACSTYSSGSHYTLARESSDHRLIEPRLVRNEPQSAVSDAVAADDFVGIKLSGGLIRYLEAVGTPEVVIFVQTRVREPTRPEDELVWQKVYLDSEEQSQVLSVNENSFVPRRDITVLPPIRMAGQEISISIRVLELDQDDNRAAMQIVESAAAVGAQFQPAAAAQISVFQAALTFLIANNSDDIEFQYDVTFTPNEPPTIYSASCKDHVTRARFGRYYVVKTEFAERFDYPNDAIDLLHTSVRYVLYQALKLGTLGIANWPIWQRVESFEVDPQTDVYRKLFGDPFALPTEAWRAPEWRGEELATSPHLGPPRRFSVRDYDLYSERVPTTSDWPTNTVLDPQLYSDQGYLSFSMYRDDVGVEMGVLRESIKNQDLIKDLGIRTTRLSNEELRSHLDAIVQSVRTVAAEKALREEFGERLAKTTTPEEAQALRDEFGPRIDALSKSLPDNVREPWERQLKRDIASDAEKRGDRLTKTVVEGAAKSGLRLDRVLLDAKKATKIILTQTANGEAMTIAPKALFVQNGATVPAASTGDPMPAVSVEIIRESAVSPHDPPMWSLTTPEGLEPGNAKLILDVASGKTKSQLCYSLEIVGSASITKVAVGEAEWLQKAGALEWKSGASIDVTATDFGHVRSIEVTPAEGDKLVFTHFGTKKNAKTGATESMSFKNGTKAAITVKSVRLLRTPLNATDGFTGSVSGS